MGSQSSLLGTLTFAAVSRAVAGTCAGPTGDRHRRFLVDLDYLCAVFVPTIWHVRVIQTVVIWYVGIVKPRTVACFPRQCANHTELGAAAAARISKYSGGMSMLYIPCHVVASLFQLHHSLAVVAPLPALLFGHLNQTGGLIVLWTLPSGMILAATTDTNFGAASTTPSILSSSWHINLDLAGLDPFTAAFCRAV